MCCNTLTISLAIWVHAPANAYYVITRPFFILVTFYWLLSKRGLSPSWGWTSSSSSTETPIKTKAVLHVKVYSGKVTSLSEGLMKIGCTLWQELWGALRRSFVLLTKLALLAQSTCKYCFTPVSKRYNSGGVSDSREACPCVFAPWYLEDLKWKLFMFWTSHFEWFLGTVCQHVQ